MYSRILQVYLVKLEKLNYHLDKWEQLGILHNFRMKNYLPEKY